MNAEWTPAERAEEERLYRRLVRADAQVARSRAAHDGAATPAALAAAERAYRAWSRAMRKAERDWELSDGSPF